MAVLVVLGLVIVAVVVLDAILTTVAPGSGGGPLTRMIGKLLWKGAHGLANDPRSAVLKAAGPVVLVTTFAVWMTGLIIGWSLVFASIADTHLTTP